MPENIPIPDPTKLTTEAVKQATDQSQKALDAVERLLTLRIDSVADGIAQLFEERDARYGQRFDAQQQAMAAALAATQDAITKAEVANDKRFDSVIASVHQLNEAVGTLMPRNEYLAQHNALIDKVDTGDSVMAARIEETKKVLGERIDTNTARAVEGIGSLNLARAEGTGRTEQKHESRLSRADIYAGVGVITAVLVAGITVLAFVLGR